MKQNILVVSYDYNLSLDLANRLAEYFSMRVLSEVDLFEFDNVPRSLSEMVALRGPEYVKEQLGREVKSSTEFENIIFVADLNMADTCKLFFEQIVQSFNIVLLSKNVEVEELELSKYNFNDYEKEIFYQTKGDLMLKKQVLSEICDVKLDVDGLTELEIFLKAVSDIKNIYNLN